MTTHRLVRRLAVTRVVPGRHGLLRTAIARGEAIIPAGSRVLLLAEGHDWDGLPSQVCSTIDWNGQRFVALTEFFNISSVRETEES
jgi:hypothetical protein